MDDLRAKLAEAGWMASDAQDWWPDSPLICVIVATLELHEALLERIEQLESRP